MLQLLVEKGFGLASNLGQFLLCLLLRCVRILLLLLEILHDRVQHGDDTGAQVAISGTAQLPSHLGRTRIFLAESCQILGFVEAFHNGLGFLHHFQGEAAVATGGLVGVLLFGSNLLQLTEAIRELRRVLLQSVHLRGQTRHLRAQVRLSRLQPGHFALQLGFGVLTSIELELAELLPLCVFGLVAPNRLHQLQHRLRRLSHALGFLGRLLLHQRHSIPDGILPVF
mmetsp:Transcript_867/g.1980  ORF Transcript_867/g.1980 Transcript_867/m.1980 type:complete len:226 (+) Transcript_867:330-1007(+)